MGMAYSNPPFELGEVLSGTDDNGNLINSEVLGTIYEFPYRDPAVRGSKTRVSSHVIRAIALRNTSGITLYGKRLAVLDDTGGVGNYENAVAYAAVLSEGHIAIIDDGLATTGVADDDIFWGIIEGPVTVLTPDAGAAFSGDIAISADLVAATAAASTGATAGRVSNVTLPGTTAGTVAFQAARNLVGRALSARTTGETQSDLLIYANIRL